MQGNPVANLIRKHRRLRNVFRLMKGTAQLDILVSPKGYRVVSLDYPFESTPRWGYGNPPHSKLFEIIDRSTPEYKNTLETFLTFKQSLIKIPLNSPADAGEPQWNNDWFEGLDAVALYSFLCMHNPNTYLEIGSGNSTKFARRAIRDHNLQTKIISVDPEPRAEIDAICDEVVRQRAESMDLDIFDRLQAGDILFIDGSHRCLMNSDATSIFLDVVPQLKSGVLVHVHDIYLPNDYPPNWKNRYYSEQYLLAAYILAEGNKFDVLLPNNFINEHPDLSRVINPLWEDPAMIGVNKNAFSFWLIMK